jgi:hypothetical protein
MPPLRDIDRIGIRRDIRLQGERGKLEGPCRKILSAKLLEKVP